VTFRSPLVKQQFNVPMQQFSVPFKHAVNMPASWSAGEGQGREKFAWLLMTCLPYIA